MSYCRNCGLEIDTLVCPICGYENPERVVPKEETKKNNHPGQRKNAKNSSHMLAGEIGSFLIGISAIILGILPIYIMMQENWTQFESFGIYLLFISSTILFMAGAYILLGGLYGLFKYYGSYQALVALIFSIISPMILLIFTLIAITEQNHSSYCYSYRYYEIGQELWIGHLFIGIMFILIGISWRDIYFRIGLDQPNIPIGSLFVLAGVLFTLMAGYSGLPWIIISVAGFGSGILFMLARSGTENIPYGRPKFRPYWIPPSDLPPPPSD